MHTIDLAILIAYFALVFGIGAYFFMNLVVIPLSAIGAQRLTLSAPFFNGIFIHVLGVGLPTAFLAASVAPSGS